jgi:hypothetical protein
LTEFSRELISRSGYEREGFAEHYDRFRPRPPRALFETNDPILSPERHRTQREASDEESDRHDDDPRGNRARIPGELHRHDDDVDEKDRQDKKMKSWNPPPVTRIGLRRLCHHCPFF